MEVLGPVRIMMRPAAHESHDRDFPTGQPRRDVAVVVEGDSGDFPGTEDLGAIIFGHPDVWSVHTCLPPPTHIAGSHACACPEPSYGPTCNRAYRPERGAAQRRSRVEGHRHAVQ
jgi:hypothetical protein